MSTLQAIAALADPRRRADAAKALAVRVGAEDLVIFVWDAEIGSHLPGVGFPKTLPSGRHWQEFVKRCAASTAMLEAELPYPDASTIRRATGFSCELESVLVLLGGAPRADSLDEVRACFPMLTRIFQAERSATAGEARAVFARSTAARAEALTASLATSQGELHRALCRLQEREQWFSTTLRSIGDAVIATDSFGRVTFMNSAATALTGWSLEDAQSKTLPEVFNIINETSRAPVENPVDKVLREGKVVTLSNHTILVQKEGVEISVDDSAAPIYDANGSLVGVVLVFRDITTERRAAIERDEQHRLAELGWRVGAALASKEPLGEQLRRCTDAVVEHVDAAFARIWALNEADRVLELRASSGMYTHLDGAHGRVPVGQFKIGLIAQEQKPHLTNDVTSDPRVSDRDWAKREGMVAFAGYPLLVEGRLVGVVGLFSKQALGEVTLRALEAIADQLAVAIDKAAAVEALANALRLNEMFVGILGHDLRNPLATLLTGADFLERQLPDEAALRTLRRMISAGHRMTEMIEQLLDLTRARLAGGLDFARARTRLNVQTLVQRTVEELQGTNPERQVVVQSFGDCTTSGDANRLLQVFSNLIANALEHGVSGTAVSVTVEGSDREIVVCVHNRGVIPADILPSIFDPFRGRQSASSKSRGLGLGLFIAQQIAIAHGGDVTVESSEIAGTVFTLRVPRSPQ